MSLCMRVCQHCFASCGAQWTDEDRERWLFFREVRCPEQTLKEFPRAWGRDDLTLATKEELLKNGFVHLPTPLYVSTIKVHEPVSTTGSPPENCQFVTEHMVMEGAMPV